MLEFAAFVLLSAILLIITLKRPYRHRFSRFFAFVSLLGLILRQASAWFIDPFSSTQIVSWILLAGSASSGCPCASAAERVWCPGRGY